MKRNVLTTIIFCNVFIFPTLYAQEKMVVEKTDKTTTEYDVTEVKQIYFDTSNSGNSTVGKAVDLGLPSGTKWADRNVGASSPEDFGDYYAWGETEVKDSYTWETYTLCDGTAYSCYDIGEDIAGTDYDVAHVKWGGNWEMPTKEQFEELINNCTWYYTVRMDDEGYGIFGYRVL